MMVTPIPSLISSTKQSALTPHPLHAKLKRKTRVVPPEKQDGNMEYKRQVYNPTSTRLHSLATQMSYRLDEGRGSCMYQIGVEDDGCHSLLDYNSVSESAKILECIARSLNAIVVRRCMIRGEVLVDRDLFDSSGKKVVENSENVMSKVVMMKGGRGEVVREHERAVFSWDNVTLDDDRRKAAAATVVGSTTNNYNCEEDNRGMDRTSNGKSSDNNVVDTNTEIKVLKKDSNSSEATFTRCELLIRRVETHRIDPSPIPLVELLTLGCSTIEAMTKTPKKKTTLSETSKLSKRKQSPSPLLITISSTQKSFCSITETLSVRNIRIGVIGNAAVGKSTLIGTLINPSILDDGRGQTFITSIAKHRHEIESGQTSTISTHLFGFRSHYIDRGGGNARGNVKGVGAGIRCGEPVVVGVNNDCSKKIGGGVLLRSVDEIVRESRSVVTLMDLPGHDKYFNTMISGLSFGFYDYTLMVINASTLSHNTNKTLPITSIIQQQQYHHYELCQSLGIPIIIILSKMDICLNRTKTRKLCMDALEKMVTNSNSNKQNKRHWMKKKRILFPVLNDEDIKPCCSNSNNTVVFSEKMKQTQSHSSSSSVVTIPVVETSCVTGEGLELLRKLLFHLPKRRRHEKKVNIPFEFLVENVFHKVPCTSDASVGVSASASSHCNDDDDVVIVSGFVNAGNLTVGSDCGVYIGPLDDGTFIQMVALSAHVCRINTLSVTSGQNACLALSFEEKEKRGKDRCSKLLRRGMVVVLRKQDFFSSSPPPRSTREFNAEICVLCGGKGGGDTIVLQKNYEVYVHVLNVRQSAFVKKITMVNTRSTVVGQDLTPPCNASAVNGMLEKKETGITLRPGSRAKVHFKFAKRPEYVRPGMRMLFRDGRVRGVGRVISILTSTCTNY